METGAIELASVLELDPHGTNDWSALAPNDGLGVRRGDLVFVHGEGATNGVMSPMVPRIGEVEDWVRETPVVGTNGQLAGWRREMADLGTHIAEERGKENSVEEPPIKRPEKDDTSLGWFGEVMNVSPTRYHGSGACGILTRSGIAAPGRDHRGHAPELDERGGPAQQAHAAVRQRGAARRPMGRR